MDNHKFNKITNIKTILIFCKKLLMIFKQLNIYQQMSPLQKKTNNSMRMRYLISQVKLLNKLFKLRSKKENIKEQLASIIHNLKKNYLKLEKDNQILILFDYYSFINYI